MASAAKKQEDNVVELRKNAPAEDAIKALNLGKMRRAKEELDSANGTYRNVLKHVEAKGIHLGAAKKALSIIKSDKREDTVAELTALFEYLYILGYPLEKKQLDMFRVEQPRTPSVDKAKEHGRYVGIMGMGMDQNPYAVDSEQGQAWLEAFYAGGKERELVLSMEPSGDELLKGSDDGSEDDDVFDEDDD